MAAPRQTIWSLEPHTRAKHEILKRYLQAWMVILSQGRFPEILYIDGFAGPGEYAGGEAGSPIIALDTALGFKTPLTAKVHFLFVEERNDRAGHLRLQVDLRTLPPNFSVVVEGGVTFEAAFTRLYPSFVRDGRLIPTFAFIDPFGWTGAPFSLVKQDFGPSQLRGFRQLHVRGNQPVHRPSGSGRKLQQILRDRGMETMHQGIRVPSEKQMPPRPLSSTIERASCVRALLRNRQRRGV